MHLKSEMVFPFYSALQLYVLLPLGRLGAIVEYEYKGLCHSFWHKGMKTNFN